MDERVRIHYELRPQTIKNSADDEPIDIDTVQRLLGVERRIGITCTEQDVSVTKVVTNGETQVE